MEDRVRDVEFEKLTAGQNLSHLESKNLEVASAKIVADDEAAAIQVLTKIRNFPGGQRKVAGFGDVHPRIFEELRAVELHDLIRLPSGVNAGEFAHHIQQEVFGERVVVVPRSFAVVEYPPPIHV